VVHVSRIENITSRKQRRNDNSWSVTLSSLVLSLSLHTHTHTRARAHAHTSAPTHTHPHTPTHTHTHTHTNISKEKDRMTTTNKYQVTLDVSTTFMSKNYITTELRSVKLDCDVQYIVQVETLLSLLSRWYGVVCWCWGSTSCAWVLLCHIYCIKMIQFARIKLFLFLSF
jgi:hypothetical protein